MPQIELNISPKIFNDTYFPHLQDYSKRYEIYYGGAGSGKSVFLTQKLLIKAMARRRKVLVIRKFATTLKDSVFQLFIDTLKQWNIYSYCKINLSTYTITLCNDSIILFKGLDNEEKIKSIAGITDIWCEEATELTEDEFTQLDLRLRAKEPDLQVFCSFNPVSRANWVFKKWFAEDAIINPNTTMILKTTYKDNKFLPKEYTDALEEKARTNPTYYRIYALGEFCSLDKLIFNNWKVEEFNHNDIKGQLVVGLDFGYSNDPSVVTASIVDENTNTIYIFKTWGDTNKTNDDLASIITSLGFAKSQIKADSAEPKSIEELRRKGITRISACSKGKDSVLYGIQALQQYQIIVHPSCEGIITEFENYSWQKDKKTGEYLNQPIDSFNHYIDALRYSIQIIDKSKKLKSFSRNGLGL